MSWKKSDGNFEISQQRFHIYARWWFSKTFDDHFLSTGHCGGQWSDIFYWDLQKKKTQPKLYSMKVEKENENRFMILASMDHGTGHWFVWTKVKIFSLICGRINTKRGTTKDSILLGLFSQLFFACSFCVVISNDALINTSHTSFTRSKRKDFREEEIKINGLVFDAVKSPWPGRHKRRAQGEKTSWRF